MPKKKQTVDPSELFLGFWQDEKAFFQYLRGRMRSIWSRYPPKIAFKTPLLIEKFEGCGVDNPRVKKVGQCNYCKNWFAASHLEVDHVIAAGGFNPNWNDFTVWVQRLLLIEGNLQLLCKSCHQCKSLADRVGITFEEAQLRRQIVAFEKLPVGQQEQILREKGLEPVKTKKGKSKQYLEKLLSE